MPFYQLLSRIEWYSGQAGKAGRAGLGTASAVPFSAPGSVGTIPQVYQDLVTCYRPTLQYDSVSAHMGEL